MAPLNNSRLAWSVAVASLALWATSVPLTWGWGQLSADATRMLDVPPTSTSIDDTPQPDEAATPCPPAPGPVISSLLPAPAPPPPPAAQVPAAVGGTGSSSEASFHLCGADASVAQAIEQLIGGRSFSASVNTTADGCADVFVRAMSPVASGSATSRLSVSLGSGQNLQIQITSRNGTTHVSITAGE